MRCVLGTTFDILGRRNLKLIASLEGEGYEHQQRQPDQLEKRDHRHLIITIDEGLWEVFLRHRKLLKPYMDKAVNVVKSYFQKKLKVTPSACLWSRV